MGQGITTTQFYLYGRRNFTKTGYEKASKKFVPGELEGAKLSGRSYMVTGANSGVGKEVSKYIASKGGTVYMVCRNPERAEKAKEEIVQETKSDSVHVLIADMTSQKSVKSMFEEQFASHIKSQSTPKLHGVVCNAGMLFWEKKLTDEGVERTFALHLLIGCYYMTKMALPFLQNAAKDNEEPRVVLVSSGGMYNFGFPKWEKASGLLDAAKYDGQAAYAFAKRGQVLLAEEWTKQYPDITFVSCHPGWTLTPAVDEVYGDLKKWLEPLRDPWEGTEGIAWLTSAPKERLESGAFYLDRVPQRKHLAGPFFTEGTRTKNTPEQIQEMMQKLEETSQKIDAGIPVQVMEETDDKDKQSAAMGTKYKKAAASS